MKTKDTLVGTQFHPILTAFLFKLDAEYRAWGSELIITSGSEQGTRHSRTSLHYATPCQAADIRIWEVADVPDAQSQLDVIKIAAEEFCVAEHLPLDWFDLILESDHIHIEYQPKRIDKH